MTLLVITFIAATTAAHFKINRQFHSSFTATHAGTYGHFSVAESEAVQTA
jgi:hypothetical protein